MWTGMYVSYFFFSSRRRHTRCYRDWSSDVCSSDLDQVGNQVVPALELHVDLRPGGVDLVALADQPVVGRQGPTDDQDRDQADQAAEHEEDQGSGCHGTVRLPQGDGMVTWSARPAGGAAKCRPPDWLRRGEPQLGRRGPASRWAASQVSTSPEARGRPAESTSAPWAVTSTSSSMRTPIPCSSGGTRSSSGWQYSPGSTVSTYPSPSVPSR